MFLINELVSDVLSAYSNPEQFVVAPIINHFA